MKYFLLLWAKQWSIAFTAKIHVTPERQGCIFVYKGFIFFFSVKPTGIVGPGNPLISSVTTLPSEVHPSVLHAKHTFLFFPPFFFQENSKTSNLPALLLSVTA